MVAVVVVLVVLEELADWDLQYLTTRWLLVVLKAPREQTKSWKSCRGSENCSRRRHRPTH